MYIFVYIYIYIIYIYNIYNYIYIYMCVCVRVCVYRQGWKLANSHCHLRITFGENANHFGQLIRNFFEPL